MKEKTKKYLIQAGYKTLFAAGIFLILFLLDVFSSELIEKISPVWTKSINIRKAGKLFLDFLKEISY